ncbi:hypothetical protein INR49_028144 [Caranx melampygus]|nr:hypothetical protein INR49_028144 [Caranx melampygus]
MSNHSLSAPPCWCFEAQALIIDSAGKCFEPFNGEGDVVDLMSWSDTDNFYSNDRSILTLSPIEATHC